MDISSSNVRRGTIAVLGTTAVLAALLPQASAQTDPAHVDPAALSRGADPAVVHLVRDTIRDGDLRVPATTRGRHDALWVVRGGYLVRDYNVGPHRSTVLTFVGATGERRAVARSRHWIAAEVSAGGGRLAVQTWHGPLEQRSVISVSEPSSGRVLATRGFRLANLVAVTGTRVLVGRRHHWRDPVTQWWRFERDTLRRLLGQAAVDADVTHDRVVVSTPARGEFCSRVAVLSNPARTLWRSCRMTPHRWSPDGTHVVATHAYFDAAGTDRWWVVDARTARREATVTGRLDWHAVWEDETHVLTLAQGDEGGAAVIRCDLSGACERASRVWDVPLPSEPSLYYAPPPVVLAEN